MLRDPWERRHHAYWYDMDPEDFDTIDNPWDRMMAKVSFFLWRMRPLVIVVIVAILIVLTIKWLSPDNPPADSQQSTSDFQTQQSASIDNE